MKQLQDVRTDIYRNAKIDEIFANHTSGVSYIVSNDKASSFNLFLGQF